MDFERLEGQTLEHMRLLIEGAVVLYENDVMPLYAMALEQQRYQEAAGLDTLGHGVDRPAKRYSGTSKRLRSPSGGQGLTCQQKHLVGFTEKTGSSARAFWAFSCRQSCKAGP